MDVSIDVEKRALREKRKKARQDAQDKMAKEKAKHAQAEKTQVDKGRRRRRLSVGRPPLAARILGEPRSVPFRLRRENVYQYGTSVLRSAGYNQGSCWRAG